MYSASFIRGELKLVVLGMRQNGELARGLFVPNVPWRKLSSFVQPHSGSLLRVCKIVTSFQIRTGNQVWALHEIINLQMDKTDDINYKAYGYTKPPKVSEKRTKYESAG